MGNVNENTWKPIAGRRERVCTGLLFSSLEALSLSSPYLAFFLSTEPHTLQLLRTSLHLTTSFVQCIGEYPLTYMLLPGTRQLGLETTST